jgi:DNA-binding transcriptional LysR family regulator
MTVPVFDAILGSKGVHRRMALTVNSWLAIPFVVAKTDLVAVVPIELTTIGGLADQLCARELPVEMPRRSYGLMWHSRDENRAAHKWFRNFIAAIFGMDANGGSA